MTIQADMELFVQVIASDLMSKKQIHFYRASCLKLSLVQREAAKKSFFLSGPALNPGH